MILYYRFVKVRFTSLNFLARNFICLPLPYMCHGVGSSVCMRVGYLNFNVGKSVTLSSKPELASNNSIQVCCYDCFNASSRDMTSLWRVKWHKMWRVASIRQSYIRRAQTPLGVSQFFSHTQHGWIVHMYEHSWHSTMWSSTSWLQQ